MRTAQEPRHRPTRAVALGLLLATVCLAAFVWVWIGQLNVSPSPSPSTSSTPEQADRLSLAEGEVIASGEIDGRRWTLRVQPFDDSICIELTGGGAGCAGLPTDASPLGVFQGFDNIEGSGFIYGPVVTEAAEVTAVLSTGEELSVRASQPAFGFRFYVIPVSAGPDAVAVTAHDEDGAGVGRVELGPQG